MAGVNYGIRKVYDYGVDGQFNTVVERRGRKVDSGVPLDFQAKASTNWERRGNCIVFDLEAKTYNDIVSSTPDETTMILIVLCLPPDQASWHVVAEEATMMRNCCYWHLLTGEATENESRKRILIPVGNQLTPQALKDLLALEKARRQNQLP
jgi:hypothetical protein